MSSAMQEPNAMPLGGDTSRRLAQQIQALSEIALPDEWYAVQGVAVAERFEAMSRAMQARDPNAPAPEELMARYENDGKPFIHRVWLNRPLICSKCRPDTGDGFFTIVSVARGLSVVVKATELHEVTTHDGAFPPETLLSLTRILEPM